MEGEEDIGCLVWGTAPTANHVGTPDYCSHLVKQLMYHTKYDFS